MFLSHQRLSAKISGLNSLCSLCPFVAHYSFPISGLKSLCSLPLLAIRGEGQGEGHLFLHVFVPPHQRLSAKISCLNSLCSLCPFVAHYSFPISGFKFLRSLAAIRGEAQGEGHRFLHA